MCSIWAKKEENQEIEPGQIPGVDGTPSRIILLDGKIEKLFATVEALQSQVDELAAKVALDTNELAMAVTTIEDALKTPPAEIEKKDKKQS